MSEEIVKPEEATVETSEAVEIQAAEKPTKSFADIVEKAKAFLETATHALSECYETYFGANKEHSDEAKERSSRIDNHYKMHDASDNRSNRSVSAITGKAVSSTKGNPTRQKKKVVVSKSYKPELDRF